MFERKVTAFLIAILMVATVALVLPVPVMAADPPVVWVRYSHKTNRPTPGYNESIDEFDISNTFTVEVWVDSNVRGIWSWQVGIRFDPTVLNCTGLAEGNIFAGKAVLGFMAGTINNTGGYVTYSGNSLKSPETTGVVGTYTLMTYDFLVVGYGNSTLDLTPGWTPNPESLPADTVAGTKLNERVDTSIVVITGTTLIDGYFDNRGLKPGPYPPTAVITQVTPEPYYVGDTIELYGGNSLPGFDGDSMRPITEYYWDFENDGFIDATGQTVFWNTTGYAPGSYNVNLTVYAPGGPNADPTYNATMQYDDTIDVKTIFEVPVGRNLDLYTQDYRAHGYSPVPDGKGPGLPAEEFQPQEEVVLMANVTYNGDVVQHKLVAFEVHGPENPYYNHTIYRTAFTNETGVATVTFRIPWPCVYSEEEIFGEWFVYAAVDIAKEKADDNMTFTVHWIVELLDVVTTDDTGALKTEFKKTEYIYVNITVKNWAMTSRNATITIVVYDELGVPIGQTVVSVVLPGGPHPDGAIDYVFTVVIHVPKWAYVGVGTVYVDAFTKIPMESGVPWCPEISTSIAISK